MNIEFVKAAKLAGVRYIVRASGMGADSPQPISLGRWHREAEKAIEDSGIAYTVLRPNSFMQNYINMAGYTIKTQNAFYFPQGDARMSIVDARDIAAVAATLLIDSKGHEGKAYNLTGPEAISNHQVAEILSKTTGREIRYMDVPEEAARTGMKQSGMPDAMVEALLELFVIIRAGYAAVVSPAVEEITGKKPRSFEQFAKDSLPFFAV